MVTNKCCHFWLVVGGNVLLVAHKGSVDVCTRQLRGMKPRGRAAFKKLTVQVPYCAVACLKEGSAPQCDSDTWQLCDPQIPPLTHKGCAAYNWKIWI